MAFAMWPEIQKKAQAELDRVVGPTRLPEYEDRESLPYVNAIFKEVLRWLGVTPVGMFHLIGVSPILTWTNSNQLILMRLRPMTCMKDISFLLAASCWGTPGPSDPYQTLRLVKIMSPLGLCSTIRLITPTPTHSSPNAG